MEARAIFYAHGTGYARSLREARSINRLLGLLARPFSPRFCHVALQAEGFVFSYGPAGYYVKAGQAQPATLGVSVELENPRALLEWDRRRDERRPQAFRLAEIALAAIWPSRFRNCASLIGRAAGVNAGTPDRLARLLEERGR